MLWDNFHLTDEETEIQWDLTMLKKKIEMELKFKPVQLFHRDLYFVVVSTMSLTARGPG